MQLKVRERERPAEEGKQSTVLKFSGLMCAANGKQTDDRS